MTIHVRNQDDKLVGVFYWDSAAPLPMPGDVLYMFDMFGNPLNIQVDSRVFRQRTIGGHLEVGEIRGRVL